MQPRRLSVWRYNNFGASGSRMTKRRLIEEARNSTWQISVQNVISSFLMLILLFVSYYLTSFKFIYFIFLERPRSPWEVHAEPLGLRGAQVGNLCYRLSGYLERNDSQATQERSHLLFPGQSRSQRVL